MFGRGGIDHTRQKRCRRAGRDMENTSPKFGVGRLSRRCRGQIDVKVEQNTKWMVTKKEKCHVGPW